MAQRGHNYDTTLFLQADPIRGTRARIIITLHPKHKGTHIFKKRKRNLTENQATVALVCFPRKAALVTEAVFQFTVQPFFLQKLRFPCEIYFTKSPFSCINHI